MKIEFGEYLRKDSKKDFLLIILNQPLSPLFKQLWINSSLNICADGGANRIYNEIPEIERSNYIPSIICGDLDSVLPHVLHYYSSNGSIIEPMKDQESTDFEKSIQRGLSILEPQPSLQTTPQLSIIALGALGGRLDHSMHAIHVIYKKSPRLIWLVSRDSLAVVVHGETEVVVDRGIEGPTCGLLPIGTETVLVETKGLKWNVDHSMPISFMNGIVSSSNAFSENREDFLEDGGGLNRQTVFIKSNLPLIWTTELF